VFREAELKAAWQDSSTSYHLDDDEIMLISCTYPSVLEVGIFSFGISFPTFSFIATARHIVILSRH
jgi:hypothetical protein